MRWHVANFQLLFLKKLTLAFSVWKLLDECLISRKFKFIYSLLFLRNFQTLQSVNWCHIYSCQEINWQDFDSHTYVLSPREDFAVVLVKFIEHRGIGRRTKDSNDSVNSWSISSDWETVIKNLNLIGYASKSKPDSLVRASMQWRKERQNGFS